MLPRFSAPGSSPATLMPVEGREKKAPALCLVEYGPDAFTEKKIASVADLPPAPPEGAPTTLWIEMNGLGDVEALRALGEKYNLHPLALEDTLNCGQRPKIDMYDNHAYIVVQMIYDRPDEAVCHEQVSIFFRQNLIITVQEEADYDVFNPVRGRLRAGRGLIRKQGADYLAYALLDSIVDHLFPVLERLGTQLEELEDRLMDKPGRTAAGEIHLLKRKMMQLRRAVWPLRDIVSAMLHEESELIGKQTKLFLRDCYDHTVQIMDLVEAYRDVAAGLMELYLSAVGMRTNEIMRVLTVISAIFIPLTFVAGVYGMNFDWAEGGHPLNMPELHWPHGYFGCLALMVLIAAGEILFFRKKGWL